MDRHTGMINIRGIKYYIYRSYNDILKEIQDHFHTKSVKQIMEMIATHGEGNFINGIKSGAIAVQVKDTDVTICLDNVTTNPNNWYLLESE